MYFLNESKFDFSHFSDIYRNFLPYKNPKSPKLDGKATLTHCLVDSIKKEVMIMGHKLNSLQMDIKTVLEELKTIQRTPTPRTSTEECHTYLVINEKKENL